MNIIKSILKSILKGVNIVLVGTLYMTSVIAYEQKYFIPFTVVIISILSWKLYKNINKSNEKQKTTRRLSVGFNLIGLAIISIFTYSVITYDGDIVSDFLEVGLLLEMEQDEYYEKMETKEYENFDIVYHKDIEPTLPLIEEYIKVIKEKTSKIFGNNTSKRVTIQIDYDEDIFMMRQMLYDGIPDKSVGGYYNSESNTIYMYTDNPVRDILQDIPKADKVGSSIIVSDVSFKDILLHEYTHYAIDSLLENNNIEPSLIPMWLEEGIAEQMTERSIFSEMDMEYISLKKLESIENWSEEMINEKSNIYTQSKYAVSKIVKEQGEQVLKDMLLSFKDKDRETIIKEYMGYSYEEFESTLETAIKEGKFENPQEHSEKNYYFDTKIECLEAYIKYDENNIDAYEFLGTLYGNNDKAIELFKLATHKNPHEYILWHRLGLAYEDMGKNELAKECFEKSESLK